MTSASPRKSLPLTLFMVVAGLFLIGCGKPEHIKTEVEPANKTITVGQTLQLRATARDPEGEAIPGMEFKWSVEGDAATIDEQGLLTGRTPGNVKVLATAGEVTGAADITIERQKVAKLLAAAKPAATTVGGDVEIQVTAQNAAGRGLAGVEVNAQTPTAGARLDRARSVTDASGSAKFKLTTAETAITNRVELKADDETAEVEVVGRPGPPAAVSIALPTPGVEASRRAEIEITVRDRAGNLVPGAVARFAAMTTGTSVEPLGATTNAQGKATVNVETSEKVGSNTIEVTVEGVPTEAFSFDTKAGPPAKLVVTPSSPATVASGKIDLTLEVSDAHQNPVPGAEIALSSATEGVSFADTTITTNDQGLAKTSLTTAAAPGLNEVVAGVPGIADVKVSITGNPPTSLKVDPENAIIEMKASQAFQALAVDDDENRAPVKVEWSVVGDKGTIDAQGVFTATSLGEEAVVARYQGLTGGAALTVTPGVPATVQLSPQAAELISGQNQQFSASVFNAHQYALDVAPQWSVSGGVGTVDAAGLFTATKAGTGTINATAGNATAHAAVTVTPGPLAAIYVEPSRLAVRAGEEVQLKADGRDAGGNSVPIEPTWSLTADLGTIDQNGSFHAEHVGSGTIRVEAGSPPVIAEIPVEVVTAALARIEVEPLSLTLSAGEDHIFHATGFDSSNNVLKIAPAWSVSGDVGTIDEHGKLTVRRTGTAKVEARVDELVGTASVTVKPGKLTSLEIEPKGPFRLQAGATVSFNLVGKDAFGNVLALKPQWEQPKPLGSFEPTGQFRATTVGTGELVARVADMEAAVEMTVVPGKLAAIDIAPEEPQATAGSTVQFTATGRDAHGNEISIEPTWRVTDQIGEITSKGEFTALQARRGEVVATAEGVSGSSTVSILPGQLTFLKVTPLQIDVRAGDQLPIAVVGYDAYGNPVPTHPVWQVPNDLGVVDANGVFTARKVGEGRIVIAAGTLAATIDVQVSLGEPARLEIEPAGGEIPSGETREFAVRAFDGGGNSIEIGPVTWEVEGSIGKVDANGAFTAILAGDGRLIATAGTLTAVTSITVTPGPAVSLELSPTSVNLTAGQTLTVQSRAVDAAGNEIPRQPNWAVEGNIGEISDHGTFKATTAGAGKVVALINGLREEVVVNVEAGRLARIEITPAEIEVEAGETQAFGATGYDAFGNICDIYPTWSLKGDIGTLHPLDGIFKAIKAGTGYVVATDEYVSGLAQVRVTPGEVARLELEPQKITLEAGQEVSFEVTAYDDQGNLTTPNLRWRMGRALGEMKGNVFHATKIGQTEITAAHDYITATARVEVELGRVTRLDVVPTEFTLEAGKSFRAAARGYDEYGNVAEVAATWRAEGTIGDVNAATGVFTAGKEGDGSLIANVGELSAQSRVTTVPGTVQRIVVRPEKAEVASTKGEAFEAIGIDAGENERPVKVRWAVSSHLGEVDPEGRFTAKGLGTGPIVAYQDGGLIGTAEVSVSPGPVVLLFVTPQPGTVQAGDTANFEVTGFDANRNPVPKLEARWRTLGGIGEIDDQMGTFTGRRVGWGKVQASVGDIVGDADVRVTPGKPSQTQSRMTSTLVDIPADGETSADITVLVRDHYGNPIANVPVTLIGRIDDQIEQPGPTNEQGITVGRIRSSKMGASEISAIVGSARIQNTLRLRFYLRGAREKVLSPIFGKNGA